MDGGHGGSERRRRSLSSACERENRGGGKSSRGREEGLDGSGRLRGVFRGVGAQAGSLEVARRVSGTQLLLLLAGGRRQHYPWWAGPVGWAASWAGQVSVLGGLPLSYSFFIVCFSFLFFLFRFDLVKILNHLIKR